jgi:NADH-quinone oxidoreductase subunit L
MTLPMIVLAAGSLGAGFLFDMNESFVRWMEPVTGEAHAASPVSHGEVSIAATAVMLIGVFGAWWQYGRRPVPAVAPVGRWATRAARRDLLQDDFNHAAFVRPGTWLTRGLVYGDHKLVDGVVNGTAAAFGGLSGRMRRVQNGFARSYAVSMFGGAALLVAATLLMRAV